MWLVASCGKIHGRYVFAARTALGLTSPSFQEKQDKVFVFVAKYPNADTPAVADFAAGHPKYVKHGAR